MEENVYILTNHLRVIPHVDRGFLGLELENPLLPAPLLLLLLLQQLLQEQQQGQPLLQQQQLLLQEQQLLLFLLQTRILPPSYQPSS